MLTKDLLPGTGQGNVTSTSFKHHSPVHVSSAGIIEQEELREITP